MNEQFQKLEKLNEKRRIIKRKSGYMEDTLLLDAEIFNLRMEIIGENNL